MSTATSMSHEELIRRRQDLLDRVKMSYEELRERAMAYTLRPEERDVYEAVRSIDYLLRG
jgi:hypothetical protein